MSRRTLLLAAIIFLAAQIAFLAGIEAPAEPYFDEVYYVAAARQLSTGGGETLNREHPPFAKLLMAASIATLGDRPIGWRFPSTLFGALALSGVFVWARQLFANEKRALWVTAVTFLDQMLYVQARIATLDVFMAAFVVWALALFSASWDARSPRLCFAACGACLGLAVASKWPGLIAWAMVVGVVLVVAVLKQWQTRFAEPRGSDWYRSDLWDAMRPRDWLLSLFLVPAAIYFLTFVPTEGWDPAAIVARQGDMASDLATVPAVHTYLSHWTQWPVIARPIWYLFDRESDGDSIRAVVLLGNPVVLWVGIPAVLACLAGWVMARRRDAFLIAASALSLYLAWALVPRAVGFHYYYFPTVLVLGLALSYLFCETRLARWRWLPHFYLLVALASFFYFLPITSAAVGVTMPGYYQRMWFDAWI